MSKTTYLITPLLFFCLVSSVLAVSYIELDKNSFDLDFKTGDPYPIIRLVSVKNVGPERARFDISSNVFWIFVYREGQPNSVSVEIPSGANVNFVLEIHPEQAPNGESSAQAAIKAVSLFDSSVLDTAIVSINLKKNVPPAPSPTPSPDSTDSPQAAPSGSPAPSPTTTPKPTLKPSPSVLPVPSKAPVISARPVSPAASPTASLLVSPVASPMASPVPLASEPAGRQVSFFEWFLEFLRKLFSFLI